MTTIDSQLLHVPRKPICQKRSAAIDSHVTISRARSPSPRKTVFASRRRHSTPQVSALRFVELRSPHPNPTIRQHYVNTRVTRATREHSPKLDLVKAPSRPTTLVKPRYPDERAARLPTTPTSLCFTTDVFLPTAKKNRTTIIDTPSPAAGECHSISDGAFAKRQWNKREKAFSVDFSSDVFVSEERALEDYTYHTLVSKRCKCCYGKFSCRCFYCNFQQYHYSCPLWCWIACVLVAFLVLVAMFLFIGLSSR